MLGLFFASGTVFFICMQIMRCNAASAWKFRVGFRTGQRDGTVISRQSRRETPGPRQKIGICRVTGLTIASSPAGGSAACRPAFGCARLRKGASTVQPDHRCRLDPQQTVLILRDLAPVRRSRHCVRGRKFFLQGVIKFGPPRRRPFPNPSAWPMRRQSAPLGDCP